MRDVVGRTPRARLLTAGTLTGIAIAIAAFVAIRSHNSGPPYDAYARAADVSCVQAKRRIAALEQSTYQLGQVGVLADGLVLIVGEWRAQTPPTFAPANRKRLVSSLDSALLDVETKAGTLARAAQAGNRHKTFAVARQIDVATTQVEHAVSALGLRRCSALHFGFARTGKAG
jgi:hypothetical protein